MENAAKPNFGLKSNTTVTISMPNAETTAESTSDEHLQIVSESTQKHQLVRDMDSNTRQIKHMKAAADNFKLLLAEKEKTLNDLQVSIQLLKQSFRPLEDKTQTTRKSVHEKRAGELDLLRQKITEAVEWEKNFNVAISDYKGKIDGKNATLKSQRKNMLAECDALERLYESEVEDTKASLKELNKVHKQSLADHVKLSDERKFQVDRLESLKQEMIQMRDQFEKIAAEKTVLKKQSQELDARVIEIEALAKLERESPALLKIEDNKRNLAMRTKQISEASTLRNQKKQTLATLKTKLTTIVQERDMLAEERQLLEKAFDDQMNEYNKIAAEIVSTQEELDHTRKRTEEFESQMYQKLNEARRQSESYSAELMREMEGVRRQSVNFSDQVQEKQRAEQDQIDQSKEQLREELQSLNEMMEVLKKGHQLEMESKQRHYERVERDLEVFGKGEKADNEFETKLIKGNIEKLGVKRNAAQAEFEELQAELKEEIEWLSRKLATVKTAADASKAIAENKQRLEVTKNLVRAMEREINAKKAKYIEMHKNAYDLKNGMTRKGLTSDFDPEAMMISQPFDITNSPIVQSPDGQVIFY